ncbi:MAG TPA: 3-methyl-2-oxobutanoate dehydrogenase subunit VorB [Candidatus Aminicenantes bacterium]|nr:3-methyl-2-oxobutanoate dehydrogenase subunit VorB [Candidatus Aminicenantes bacterium]
MPDTRFMKGNEALAEAAIRVGLTGYFGYPITPQSEVVEYLAAQEPNYKYVLLQAESEVASINMVYGAAGAGGRVMTSTSSPGFSLMQEGLSYIACAELPCVIYNASRGGPGLGTIQPSQGDYFQSVKGGGHGDYRLLTLAPNSVQEMVDHTALAFDLADKYQTPALILADGAIGQIMEKVVLPDAKPYLPNKPWAATGKPKTRAKNLINSLYIESEELEKKNQRLQEKYQQIEEAETRYEGYKLDDAEVVLVGYGVISRIAKKVVDLAREEGIKMGLMRPITLWPFPSKVLAELAGRPNVRFFMSIEMSCGQMVEDVRLAVNGTKPVHFYGRSGGIVPTPDEVLTVAKGHLKS